MGEKKLDQEWVGLILEALKMGISPQEIKAFFQENADKDGADKADVTVQLNPMEDKNFKSI